MTFPCLQQRNDGTGLTIRVQPRSSRNQIAGLHGDALKVKLAAPPVDGAANKACCDFLARLFGLSRRSVSLVSGATGRNKVVLLAGLAPEQAAAILEPLLGDKTTS